MSIQTACQIGRLRNRKFRLLKPHRAREIRPIEDTLLTLEISSDSEDSPNPAEELNFQDSKEVRNRLRMFEAILDLGRHHTFGTYMGANGVVTIAPKGLVPEGDFIDLPEIEAEIERAKQEIELGDAA